MKYLSFLLFFLFLFVPNESYCKTSDETEAITIKLSVPIYKYVYELGKSTKSFSLSLQYKSNVKGISFTYTRKRESETPLNLPVPVAGKNEVAEADQTVKILEFTNLLPGDIYNIKIIYNDAEEKTVEIEVLVPSKNFWTISYGNNFIFNRSFNPDGNQNYFLKQGTAGNYTISSKKGEALDYAPSINFMNLQYAKNGYVGWAYGVSLGLETNSATPTVTFGGGAHFGYQVQLLAGIVMHQTPTLRPEYHVGEVVTSLLSTEQLTKNTYRGDLFISLNIRFDKNPRE